MILSSYIDPLNVVNINEGPAYSESVSKSWVYPTIRTVGRILEMLRSWVSNPNFYLVEFSCLIHHFNCSNIIFDRCLLNAVLQSARDTILVRKITGFLSLLVYFMFFWVSCDLVTKITKFLVTNYNNEELICRFDVAGHSLTLTPIWEETTGENKACGTPLRW